MRRLNLVWFAASFIVAVLAVIGWQAIVDARVVSPIFLPGPIQTFKALTSGFSRGPLLWDSVETIVRMLLGWFLASLLGIALGAMIGTSRLARIYIGPTLEALRPLPASALIPVAIALFGLSETTILLVIAFGALWPMLLATSHGVSSVEPLLGEVAAAMRMSRLAIIFKIGLPNAMPEITASMRLGLTIALILAIVCEMLCGTAGLGRWILLAARSFRSADLFAGVAILSAIGYVSSTILKMLDRRLSRWRHVG